MIVRLMGEGQYEVGDEVAAQLDHLDAQAGQAVDDGNEEELQRLLTEMHDAVTSAGKRLADNYLGESEGMVPPADLSLAEARQLFEGEGLIPDLPG